MFIRTELVHALRVSDRRCFDRKEAASYVGVSAGTFDSLVKLGQMPKPIRLKRRKVWDHAALDQAIDGLSGISSATSNLAEAETPLDVWRRKHGQS